jgi:iron(III) transport system permease protein
MNNNPRQNLFLSNAFLGVLIAAFFIAFLFFPLWHVLRQAIIVDGILSTKLFLLLFENPVQRECVITSLEIGLLTTILTTVISLWLAFLMGRCTFKGKTVLGSLLLLPMIMPPFVGAIGIRHLFARFGPVNLLLSKTGFIPALMHLGILSEPYIDWLGHGFWGVIVLETLHLYPIMYLNILAAMSNIEPSMEEAAENLGAGGLRLFRTITIPLLLPGYFAGATLVFIWAFTDLGTPLIFELYRVVPVQIFNMVTDINENPMAYALVVLVMLLTVTFFFISKRLLSTKKVEMMRRSTVTARKLLTGKRVALAYLLTGLLIFFALIPHLGVVLASITKKWFMSITPQEITFEHYISSFTHPLCGISIRNSLIFSILSTIIDICLGTLIGFLLLRRRIRWAEILDLTAMLPLALPGIVLAFGYVACFSNTILDPRENPVILIIVSYSMRRLPYSVRAAYAGFQQSSITLDEASQNLGASPLTTLLRISLPLLRANLIAGGILAFSFAMLEVSDSLILAMKERFYPITKAIYVMFGRLADGPNIASAMGILGVILLGISLFLAARFAGRQLGEIFRT